MNSFAWTDERIARLIELWQLGLSCSEIAADLGGISRNAVIGKVHRLGCQGRRNGGSKTLFTPEMDQRLRELWDDMIPAEAIAEELGCGLTARRVMCRAGYLRLGSRRPNRKISSTGKPPLVRKRGKYSIYSAAGTTAPQMVITPNVDKSIPIMQRRSLLQLNNHTCRWPVGEIGDPGFFFCGAEPVEGRPYCSAHVRRAYDPARVLTVHALGRAAA